AASPSRPPRPPTSRRDARSVGQPNSDGSSTTRSAPSPSSPTFSGSLTMDNFLPPRLGQGCNRCVTRQRYSRGVWPALWPTPSSTLPLPPGEAHPPAQPAPEMAATPPPREPVLLVRYPRRLLV